MTDHKKVFVDTAPFIYFIEKDEDNPQYFDKVKDFFDKAYKNNINFVTSVITVEEYMVFPYRINSQTYIDMFERLINILGFKAIVIDEKTARKAARIRAGHKSFKTMDALQLAAASINDCDLFLTNDKQLRQFEEIKCITVDELDEI